MKTWPLLVPGYTIKVRRFPEVVVVVPYISSCGSLEIMKGTEDPKVSHTRAAVKNPKSKDWDLGLKLFV